VCVVESGGNMFWFELDRSVPATADVYEKRTDGSVKMVGIPQ